MVTKKIRTEYMKRFRDPKWETFSKCYEDSLKYRLSRRVMEHSHKPWFWEGWDSSSGSSGWSTPRPSRNKTAPLSVARPAAGAKPRTDPPSGERRGGEAGGEAGGGAAPAAVVENGVSEDGGGSAAAVAPDPGGSSGDADSGPADSTSSEGEPANSPPKRRPRRRAPPRQDGPPADEPAAPRKTPRAKSQPPIGAKESRRPPGRPDWARRHAEVKRAPNDILTSDACVQTRRASGKRASEPDRRRARSADLEKTRTSQLTAVDDRWVTEYMRCFSARLRNTCRKRRESTSFQRWNGKKRRSACSRFARGATPRLHTRSPSAVPW
uniref:Centriole, cilia and spindle-associated protein a n=1 Tax=Gasterosteus aculeatus aculeatus TaxID=481459 RepID=A0AAQ4NVV4_GASAC